VFAYGRLIQNLKDLRDLGFGVEGFGFTLDIVACPEKNVDQWPQHNLVSGFRFSVSALGFRV